MKRVWISFASNQFALSRSIYSWIVLVSISILYFLDNYSRYLLAVSPIPYIDYNSYEYALLVGPLFAICYTVGGVVIALASEKSRVISAESNASEDITITLYVICAGTGIFSSAFFCSSLATTFWQQAIIRMTMGVAQSIITPFSCGVIKQLFPSHLQGVAFGLFNVGTYFAFSMSLSLGTYIYDEQGWKAGYQIFGMIGAAAAILLAALFRILKPYAGLDDPIRLGGDRIDNNVYSRISNESISGKISVSDKDDKRLLDGSHMNKSNSQSMTEPQMWFETSQQIIKELVRYWRQEPIIVLISITTGVRLGAGYIWSAYTSVFFNELFVVEESSTCQFSFNLTSTISGACDADYPFCRGDQCYAINTYPWHNRGMPHQTLEEYMSWVPLAGSAVGTILGGAIADGLVLRFKSYCHPSTIRLVICAVGCAIATPLVASSFFLPVPGCFLALMFSGLVGEAYLGQIFAVVTELSPKDCVITSAALFMLVITIIGGSAPLGVSAVTKSLDNHEVTIQFSAQAEAPFTGEEDFVVSIADASAQQLSLAIILGCCYGLSTMLFGLCAWLKNMSFDSMHESPQ